ncbi:MAG: serine hydrolase domain-containing protein [Candidatus Bathyarchaeota archaeon]
MPSSRLVAENIEVEVEMSNVHRQSFRVLVVFLLLIITGSVYVNGQRPHYISSTTGVLEFPYASPESQGLSSETLAKLAETVRDYLDEETIVGAELLVIKNRNIVLHEVVGWKDRENEIPMEKNSLFNIRSMTKPVTGAAVQILIDEGRLRLDTEAAEYIQGFDNENSRSITVEQLLSHMSGLPLSLLTSADEYETLFSLANATGNLGPEFEPGSKFWYSDAGTEVLGAIVEAETGYSLDAFVTERILDPLKMNDAFYYHPATLNDSRRDRIPVLYVGGVGEWVRVWSPDEPLYPFAFGSQGLYCTPVNYARFLAMWMDDGQIGWKQLLSPTAVRRTLTPVTKMSSLGSDMPYPTGFYDLEAYYGQMAILFSNSTTGEPEVIGHSGSDGTYAWAWPEQDIMILYFTQSRGSTSGIKLESRIDELLIHPELAEINANVREQYADYLGSYTANFGPFRNTEFKVTVQNGRLAVDIPNQLVFELEEPDAEGLQRFKIMGQIAVSFNLDDSGAVTSMTLHEPGGVNILTRGPPAQEEAYPENMERYVGEYQTEDPNITMKVVILNGRLALDIPGQPIPLELYPPDNNGIWYIRVNPTIAVSFNVGEDEKIHSFNLHLPDGTVITRQRIDDDN